VSAPFFLSAALPFLLAGGCVPPSLISPAPREVRGTLTEDETWGGEITVVDDFLVPAGRTLRILPGTVIRVRTADTSRTEPEFLDNRTELLVRGRLIAEGKADALISFAAAGPPGEAGGRSWAGVIFDGGEGRISHCRISGSEYGVLLLSSAPRLEEVRITGVRHGVMLYGPSTSRMEGITVEADEGGIYSWAGSAPRISGSSFRGGEREGMVVAPGASPQIETSSFDGPFGGVLWGASTPPPKELEGDVVVAAVEPAPSPRGDWRVEGWQAPPPGFGNGERVYRGENFIGRDESWEGRVLIDGTVMVAPGAVLTIRPGTRVRFAFRDSNGDGVGESELFVQGRIIAAGERDRPIVFTAAGRQGPGRWGAINIMGSDLEENFFGWCRIESSYRGLHSHFSTFRVEHCSFRDNYRGLQFQESKAVIVGAGIFANSSGLRFRDSRVVIEETRIAGNTLGLQALRSQISLSSSLVEDNLLAGIHLREAEGAIGGCRIAGNSPGLRASRGRLRMEGNVVEGNGYGGIQLRGTEAVFTANRFAGNAGNGFSSDSPAVSLEGNAFSGNLRFALENNSPSAVEAPRNYWGGLAGVEDRIYDSRDDPSVGEVLFDPVLENPPGGRPDPQY
jgi:nitrous oxidase accessory protein NosD